MDRALVFIPTFNERENVEALYKQIRAVDLPLDILFVDDNSPDGTGEALDRLLAEDTHASVVHRAGKEGIGSAHLYAIRHSYEQGYKTLVTMDCDFTHSPSDIPRLLAALQSCDVAVGSRYLQAGSLPGWSPFRRSLTLFAHSLTKHLLGLAADASGAFRAYNLRKIPQEVFGLVLSQSYSFFFESLFVLSRNSCSVAEIPIVLPARTYGHSKLTFREAWRSFKFLIRLSAENFVSPARFRIVRRVQSIDAPDASRLASEEWDVYWRRKSQVSLLVYEVVASIYRRLVIRPNLERALLRQFPRGGSLLHAGCGSGQVDERLHQRFQITAADISIEAVRLYARNNPGAHAVDHADVFALPYKDGCFDGVYNLGVVEHFSPADIVRMLTEFRRVVKPGGRVVIFWPHRKAPSVLVLHVLHFCMRLTGSQTQLHPLEPSLLRERSFAREIFTQAGLEWAGYDYGIRDGFIQAVVAGRKPTDVAEAAP